MKSKGPPRQLTDLRRLASPGGAEAGIGVGQDRDRERLLRVPLAPTPERLQRLLAGRRAGHHGFPETLHLSSYTLYPTLNTLHPAPHTLHSTLYTPHPTPFTMNLKRETLKHKTLNTLHPSPYTLHPEGETQNTQPSPSKLDPGGAGGRLREWQEYRGTPHPKPQT